MTGETRARGGAKQYNNKKLHKINDASFDGLELIVVIVFHLHTVAGKEHRLPCLSLVPATDFVSSRDFLVYSASSFFPFTPSALHPCLLFLPGSSFYFHSRLLFPSATSFYLKTHALFSICDVKLAIPWLYTLTSVSIFSTLFQYISSGSEKENLSINQELLSLFIIFLILVTLMSYSGVIS